MMLKALLCFSVLLLSASVAVGQITLPAYRGVLVASGPTFPYSYQRVITVSNSSGGSIPTGYSVSYTFDHAVLVSGGKSLASGADVRLYYYNGSTFAEIPRAIDMSAGWNTATSKIWFRTQASVANGATDNHYYLYYGGPRATLPSYEWQNKSIFAVNPTLSFQVRGTVDFDHSTFSSDGTDFWKAGANYPNTYAADTWYMFSGFREWFTAAQINNYVTKFVAAKDANGDLPICLATDATACSFYSANDTVHAYATGDGWSFVPQMALLAYQKSGDLTTFNAVAASLKTALLRVPLSGGLVNVPNGSEWVPWGFQDGVKFGGGVHMMGSLNFYAACRAMATLYTAAGDSANAAIFSGLASDVANNLDALWNSSDGMYHASTGSNNNQIDILGSAYALYLGVAGASHSTAISNYLVTNYSSLIYEGFIRQSPTNWGRKWSPGTHPDGTYDDGYWSVGHLWIAAALAYSNVTQAQQFITDFAASSNPSIEWINQPGYTGPTPSIGNLESPMGAYRWTVEDSDLYSATVSSADFSGVFTLWDDFSTHNRAWQHPLDYHWYINSSGQMQQPSTINNEDSKLTRYDANLSDGLLVQVDYLVDTYTGGGHAVAGACLASLDTGTNTARGYCSQTKSDSTTKLYVLNEQVAWSTGANFTWTTGIWYRTQIARSGSTIYRKTWAVGSAEPGSWSETYTQSNNLSNIGVSLAGGYSTTRFDNLIVRKFVPTEPTTSASAEAPTGGRQAP